MKRFIALCFIFLGIGYASHCQLDEQEITLKRHYTYFSKDEYLEIREGNQPDSPIVFSLQGKSEDIYKDYVFQFCAKPVLHTIIMKDYTGTGWGELDYPSWFDLYANDVFLDRYSMNYVDGGSYYEDSDFITFVKGKDFGSEWYYSDIPQIDTKWSESIPSDWTLATRETTTEQKTITRYYIQKIDISYSFEELLSFMVSLYTKAGYVLYINGHEIFRYKMNEGNLNGTIPATKPNGINNYTQIIPIPKYAYTLKDTSIIMGIEVHQYSIEDIQNDVLFDMALTIRYKDKQNSHGLLKDSSVTCDPYGQGVFEKCENIVNEYSNSYWYQMVATSLLFNATLPKGQYIWGDAYIIKKNSGGYGDPQKWSLYGRFIEGEGEGEEEEEEEGEGEEIPWTLLDHQEHFIFNKNSYLISLGGLKKHYNQILLNATESTRDNIGLGGLQFVITSSPSVEDTIQYPVNIINLTLSVDSAELWPITGFHNQYTVSPSFPAGITIDSNNGHISGFPLSVFDEKFVISAKHIYTNVESSFTLQINVEGCFFPNNIPIQIIKNGGHRSNKETFKIYNETNHLIYSYDNTSPSNTYEACIPTGILHFKLYDSEGNGWNIGGALVINMKEDFSYNPFTRMILRKGSYEEYTINTKMTIEPNSPTWLYQQGIDASNWFKRSYNPINWSTLNYTSLPASTNTIQLYRNVIQVNKSKGYNGFELRIKYLSGFIVYINDIEYYRYNINDPYITNTTIPLETKKQPQWITISGPISLLNIGRNLIAIGLVNSKQIQIPQIFFNSHVLLLQNSAENSRLFGMSVEDNQHGTNTGYLIDLFTKDYWFADPPVMNYTSVLFSFNEYRVEYINKYCISSGSNLYYDPYSWEFYASQDKENYILLDTQEGVLFDEREETLCFYIPNNKSPYRYYLWNITRMANPFVGYYRFAASEFLMLNENLRDLTVPSFSLSPNPLIGYVNVSFPKVTKNSKYYTHMTISPPLPDSLTFDTSSGNIRGTLNTTLPLSKYTITTLGINKEEQSIEYEIGIQRCTYPNNYVYFNMVGGERSYSQQFTIDTIDGQRIDYQRYMRPKMNNIYTYCLPINTYILTMIDTNKYGWENDGYAAMYNEKNELIFKTYLKKLFEKDQFYFTIGYINTPLLTSWTYKYTSRQLSFHWKDIDYKPINWSDSTTEQLPIPTYHYAYYRNLFSISKQKQFIGLQVSIETIGGFAVFINGIELFKYNYPHPSVLSNSSPFFMKHSRDYHHLLNENSTDYNQEYNLFNRHHHHHHHMRHNHLFEENHNDSSLFSSSPRPSRRSFFHRSPPPPPPFEENNHENSRIKSMYHHYSSKSSDSFKYHTKYPHQSFTSFSSLYTNETIYRYIETYLLSNSIFKEGINTLAIAVYYYDIPEYTKTINNNSLPFESTISYIGPYSTTLPNVLITNENKVEEKQEKLIQIMDNNKNTVYSTGPSCENTTITFYYPHSKELFNGYSITTGSTCNKRHPTSWKIEGSNNNIEYTTLHIVYNETFTEFTQTKNYKFVNIHSYTYIRYISLECNGNPLPNESTLECLYGSSTDEKSFQLSEIHFFMNKIQLDCPENHGYSGGIDNEYSYKSCDSYYTGHIQSLCKNHEYIQEINHCSLLPPQSIQYSSKEYPIYVNNNFSIKPLIRAANYTCHTIPSILPEHVSFNINDASFEGNSIPLFDKQEYIIICDNMKGSINTTLTLISIPLSEPSTISVILIIFAVIILSTLFSFLIAKKYIKNKHIRKNSNPSSMTKPMIQ
ncbi:hypothetical protein WA158_003291 [Blastocystis sp. Blastoise]